MDFIKNTCYILLLVQIVSANFDLRSQQENNNSAYCIYDEEVTTFISVVRNHTEYIKKYKMFGLRFGQDIPVVRLVSERVPHKIIRQVSRCCEGYKMNEVNRMCVPHCEQPCPEHAACIQPNQCKCQDGYKEIRDTQQFLFCEVSVAADEVQEIESTPLVYVAAARETTLKQVLETTSEISTNFERVLAENTAVAWEKETREEQVGETTSAVSTDFERKLLFDCQLNGCPDNAECQNNSVCACLPGYEWVEVTATKSNVCLPLNEYIYSTQSMTEFSSTFIFILLAILMGVVMLIILVATLTRNFLLHRKDKLRLNDEPKKDKKQLCKYVRNDEESVAVVY